MITVNATDGRTDRQTSHDGFPDTLAGFVLGREKWKKERDGKEGKGKGKEREKRGGKGDGGEGLMPLGEVASWC